MNAINPKTNCAGRECPERDGCRRYEVRIHDRIEQVKGHSVPRLEWASFDVERARTGSCPHRIALHERLARMPLRKAA